MKKTSKQLAHELVDLVFEAAEKGMDITCEIRPLCVIGAYDILGCDDELKGLYLKDYRITKVSQGTSFFELEQMVEQVKNYVKNGKDTLEEA